MDKTRNLPNATGFNPRMLSSGKPAFSDPMELPHSSTSFDSETLMDHDLMVKIGHGDHAAFRTLVERHQNSLVGTISKMLGNESDSEDIAQQVFIRIWKHAKRYKPDNKFTTYLYTIARNLVYNESRRRSRKRTSSSDQLEEDHHLQFPAEANQEPDNHLLESELRIAIDAAIEKLPENQRLALILRRYENVPYEEIAVILKTSVPSVKSLLFRARTTLREHLAKYLDE
jgi:RNA polymerase sigma-70 factor (ECF subfamily)